MSAKFDNDPQIRRISALLKKAESLVRMGDENSQREADACNEMAAKLISKHNIDQAMLAAKGEIEDAIISKYIRMSDGYTIDKKVLLNSIIKALKAQVVFIKTRRPGTEQSYKYVAHVFAYERDLERIEFLFEMLQPQMLLGAAAAQAPYWENKRSFRKSWMLGFSAAIKERLQRTQTEATAEAGAGTDLVLFDRSQAVKQSFDIAHPPKGISRTPRSLQGSGLSQGYVAGQKASFGDNQLGNSRRALSAG